jgi:hypothetical protein
MSMFQFETQTADLQNRYAQDSAQSEYGRFMGQQRYARNREGMNRDFMQRFPRFTGQWAGRLGSGVKSGVFKQGLTDNVNNFNRALGEVDTDQAASEGQFATQQAMRDAAYRRSLMALQEQFAAQQASADPFAAYSGAY